MAKDELHGWSLRAFQAWPLLTFAARHRHIFTYGELGQHLGLPAIAVGEAVGPVYRYCKAKGLPLLNFIVVNEETGRPSLDIAKNYDIPAEQAKVFRHEWLSVENHAAAVPSIEDFQETDKEAAA